MRSIEQIIEALEDSGEEWYEIFDNKEEAKKVLSQAANDLPEEHELALLIAMLEVEEDVYTHGKQKAYKSCIRKLKRLMR